MRLSASLRFPDDWHWRGRVSAAHQRHRTTSDRNNNQHDIYPRNTQRAQRAAMLLPSFRSPRLCNYDFIFMDINYTGRLAVSLYSILIQGCRHNGNPAATRTHSAHLPVGEGRYPAGGGEGRRGEEGQCAIVGYTVDFTSSLRTSSQHETCARFSFFLPRFPFALLRAGFCTHTHMLNIV